MDSDEFCVMGDTESIVGNAEGLSHGDGGHESGYCAVAGVEDAESAVFLGELEDRQCMIRNVFGCRVEESGKEVSGLVVNGGSE